MHLPTFKQTLSFLYETIARKKDYFVSADKLQIQGWIRHNKYFLYSFTLRTNVLSIYSLIHIHIYICITGP